MEQNAVDLGILFILGISVLGGILGAWFFQKIKFPQVVGYIVIGLLLGKSGLGIVGEHAVRDLRPLNIFALGIIGFLVGGELKIDTFRKYFKQFAAILLGEGLGAFFLVSIPCTLILYLVIPNFSVALAAGIVFGAIASATDPASTIDVLWEYRCKGVLTTCITAIVALDDALAMTLYGLGVGTAVMLTSGGNSFSAELSKVSIELLGAIAAGLMASGVMIFLLKWLHEEEKSLATSLGIILLLISSAVMWDMDVILAAMTLGFVVTNAAPKRSEDLFKVLRAFSTPIYVLFFVLIGARLGLDNMPGWLWGIVAVYVVGRSIGKMSGAYVCAKAAGSAVAVRRYLGIGLFAQGGVAVGLSLMASQRLGHIPVNSTLMLGDAIIYAVTATTLIVQLIGPPLVKLSVKLAGETGKNVTEEDIIATLKVEDVMDKDISRIPEYMPISEVIKVFAGDEYMVYPVVDVDNRILGTISLENVRNVLDNHESWSWLVASDIMEHFSGSAKPSSPLKDILRNMKDMRIDQVPVVADEDTRRPAGMLDIARVRKRIGMELMKREEAAAV